MIQNQIYGIAILLIGLIITGPIKLAHASEDVALLDTDQSYADAVFALENAIINRGYKVDYHGFIGDMLKRTGSDVGSDKKLYGDAEFFTFCSAVMSRKMMEEAAENIAFCPYVLFVYSDADDPSKVTVGYRKLPVGGARDEINIALDEIIKEASGGF
jgi:uncharacterized protein (DUF302 family)